ncbi:Putative qsr prophage outer membrane porin [Vibrio aestuarianus]|uniref:Qsr prophage outer membrane porin n=1 Tax=Vibrio aestuarianus TaxID=28171 RepID=A0ABN8TSF2_9VIBR|nr:porin [Vibrio aestuarianus]MDE1256941.1 porin [Vibrio aestuarianus]NLS58298.1 porin [Vibrio aestuarianus subsp. francensis]CAH8196628.1 Putative qsr prophage outer membrane porin [Vibrio aestuarianus]CAH8215318.1 Putative qsr prophage outer membrane porin [Vibrio aestuarianus]CAH8232858.1 Putative qsr prophage outer membrane porin [Vibrio aestuarianus]
MKKTLLALLVASAATSVSAVELYSSDTSTLAIKGEVDGYLRTSEVEVTGKAKDKEDLNVDYWAYAQVDYEHKLNDSVSAFGSFEIETSGSNAVFDDVVAGFKGNFGKVSIGETGDALDAIEKTDISNEGPYFGTPGHELESKGKGLRYQVDAGPVAISLDWQSTSADNSDDAYGISVDWNFGMGSVGVAYVDYGKLAGATVDSSVAGIALGINPVDALFLGLSYTDYENIAYAVTGGSNSDIKGELPAHDGQSFGFAISYDFEPVKIYATYALIDGDNIAGTKVDAELNSYLLGVDYTVMDNLNVFLEYTAAEIDGTSVVKTDANQTILGMYLSF